MEQEQLQSLRSRLETERFSIEKQLVDHGASATEDGVSVSVDEGFADSAQATAERSELLSLVEQLHQSHLEVTAALDRLDAGSYGSCESCGRSIPIERLEALPTANLCVACKESASNR